VRAATLLVRRFHIKPQDVAVLSQYRAQCSDIEKELLKRGEKDITVSTVVAAQGLFIFSYYSFDYNPIDLCLQYHPVDIIVCLLASL